MNARLKSLVAVIVTLAVAALLGGSPGATAQASAPAAPSASAADSTSRVIARSPLGKARSRIVGTTASGQPVTGHIIPLQFKRADGKLKLRALVNGVVHRADGTRSTFSTLRTMRVKTIEGAPVGAAQRSTVSRASCDILNLVLGPLDLDLLGLKVHLDRVVLNIVAESGAGNLLGNLLCSVAGLLDGGGLLGRITDLLNRILDRLRLGV